MFRLLKVYRHIIVRTLLFSCLAMPLSCQSGPELAAVQSSPQYTLRLGEKVELGQQWGSRYEVFVEGGGAQQNRLAFYGYDLNGDGRFEFVEHIDESGTVIRRGYDLDFDGDLDMLEPEMQDSVIESQNSQ